MSNKPNFLFFFSDQHRGDWMPYDRPVREKMGVAELELNMPNIRGMMDRGVSFSNAYSPAPVCAPARACLASGLRYRSCRVYQNNVNYDPVLPSFYRSLHENGYFVTGVGKFDLNKADLDWGDGFHDTLQRIGFSNAWDSEGKMDAVWAALAGKPGPYGQMLEQAGLLDKYVDDMLSRGCTDRPTPLPDRYYADNWIGERSLKLIHQLPQDQPWFMQINFSGPHDPWDVTQRMKSAMANRVFPLAADCPKPENNQGVRQNYAAMIENIDQIIGRCVTILKERGMLGNTVLIYASDHGEMMGDHGYYGKSRGEQGSVHIPMVIDASHFNGQQGINSEALVELQDLSSTILDYAGIRSDGVSESISLRNVVEGKTTRVRDFAVSELITPNRNGPLNSFSTITDGKWKLIMENGRPDRLYDLETDPFECQDAAQEYPEQVERLRRAFSEQGKRSNPAAEKYIQSIYAH